MAVLVAAAVVPAARSEDPPGDRSGRPAAGEQAKGQARERAQERVKERAERAKQRAERAAEQAKERAKAARAKAQKERAQKDRRGDAKREARCGEVLAMGEVLEVGADSFLVDVARSNHGRLRGHEIRFLVRDKTGFKGAEGVDDLGEGDSVLIHARACKQGDRVQYLAGRVEVKERAVRDSEEEADEDSEEQSEDAEEAEESEDESGEDVDSEEEAEEDVESEEPDE